MEKTQKTFLWVFILAVLALAAFGIWYYISSLRLQGLPEEVSIAETAAADAGGGRMVNDLTPSSLNYTQAVAIFNNSRVQFNEDCRMQPARLTVRNGSTVMFDNRNRNTLGFALDGGLYTLPGYGFKLLRLTVDKVPGFVTVDCGTKNGVGLIELQ